MAVIYGRPNLTEFIQSSPSPSVSLRTDYNGTVGGEILIGSSDLVVTHLGRWVVSGSTQIHRISIWDKDTQQRLLYTDLDINGSPSGYQYASITPILTLNAGSRYMVSSLEYIGGDSWYQQHTPAIISNDITLVRSCYFGGDNFPSAGAGNSRIFVPPNFKYYKK